MATEPTVQQAVAFFDGTSLFHTAKKSFDHTRPRFHLSTTPSYDPTAVSVSPGVPVVSPTMLSAVPGRTLVRGWVAPHWIGCPGEAPAP
jgi:hypothetical protein